MEELLRKIACRVHYMNNNEAAPPAFKTGILDPWDMDTRVFRKEVDGRLITTNEGIYWLKAEDSTHFRSVILHDTASDKDPQRFRSGHEVYKEHLNLCANKLPPKTYYIGDAKGRNGLYGRLCLKQYNDYWYKGDVMPTKYPSFYLYFGYNGENQRNVQNALSTRLFAFELRQLCGLVDLKTFTSGMLECICIASFIAKYHKIIYGDNVKKICYPYGNASLPNQSKLNSYIGKGNDIKSSLKLALSGNDDLLASFLDIADAFDF